MFRLISTAGVSVFIAILLPKHWFSRPFARPIVTPRFELFAVGQARLNGRPQKIRDRHAGNFAWILESHEKTATGPFIRFQLEKIFPVHHHLALGDLVVRMSSQYLGKGAFP